MPSLPEVSESDLSIWDDEYSKCAGYLNKKASQSSAFRKGQWQRRWFVIETHALSDNENYLLQYYHSPDDKTPRQGYPLANSTIKIINDLSFVLMFHDETTLALSADNSEIMRLWIQTLERVITVANMREKLMDHFDRFSDHSNDNGLNHNTTFSRSKARRGGGGGSGGGGGGGDDESNHSQASRPSQYNGTNNSNHGRLQWVRNNRFHHFPMLRLDIDLQTMPPGSSERHEFLHHLYQDFHSILGITEEKFEVLSLRSAPGKDWLTLLELKINDQDALRQLYELLLDSSSSLYMGFVTSRLDPSYTTSLRRCLQVKGIINNHNNNNNNTGYDDSNDMEDYDNKHEEGSVGGGVGGSGSSAAVVVDSSELYSNDARILQIMHRYHSLPALTTNQSSSFYGVPSCYKEIKVIFEDRMSIIKVLNPDVFPDRACVLHVFEIQQALGMLGTLQELYLRPRALRPYGSSGNQRQAIYNKSKLNPEGGEDVLYFKSSIRHNGLEVIPIRQLGNCDEWEVECEDERDNALNSLSKEEMASIKDVYQHLERYHRGEQQQDNLSVVGGSGGDGNGGGIHLDDYEEVLRDRVRSYETLIEQQYMSYLNENDLHILRDTPSHHVHYIEEELKLLNHKRQQYRQSLHEMFMKCLLLLQASDVFLSKHISFTEFILIETWWLRCAVNPERANLF
eukprot:gene5398-5936_t